MWKNFQSVCIFFNSSKFIYFKIIAKLPSEPSGKPIAKLEGVN